MLGALVLGGIDLPAEKEVGHGEKLGEERAEARARRVDRSLAVRWHQGCIVRAGDGTVPE